MKKLHLVLASLATATSFLLTPQSAWANQSDDSQESSSAVSESSKELENKEQEEAFFKTLSNHPRTGCMKLWMARSPLSQLNVPTRFQRIGRCIHP